MKYPSIPYPQLPGNSYSAEDMRKYGQACHDAALDEILEKIEARKNAQN